MRLHLVDGTYELYRAHYSPRPDHREPSGADAKATVGIVESMLALLHDADDYSAPGSWTRTAAALPAVLHALRERDLQPVDL